MKKFRRRGQQVPPAPGGSSPRRPARQDARLQIQDVLPGRIRPAPARGSSPPGRHVGPDRGRGASLRSAAGRGGGVASASPSWSARNSPGRAVKPRGTQPFRVR